MCINLQYLKQNLYYCPIFIFFKNSPCLHFGQATAGTNKLWICDKSIKNEIQHKAPVNLLHESIQNEKYMEFGNTQVCAKLYKPKKLIANLCDKLKCIE